MEMLLNIYFVLSRLENGHVGAYLFWIVYVLILDVYGVVFSHMLLLK